MMTKEIEQKIEELFRNTPDDISVGYGFKRVGGEYTTEQCIVFGAVKKLPLSEIPENEVLPSSVEINGVVYNTDVVETGVIKLLACNNSATNPCFQYGYPPDPYAKLTPNSQLQRPLLGGSGLGTKLTNTTGDGGYGGGTLGFIAKHTATGKIVGVSNSHVLYMGAYNFRSIEFDPQLELPIVSNTYGIRQPFESTASGIFIGRLLYVQQTKRLPLQNQVDGGIFSLTQYDSLNRPVLTTESWKQVGLDIGTTPPPFATTTELNNLLNYPNLEVVSSGLATGPKQGTCGLRISTINTSIRLTTKSNFNNLIEYTRIDPTCNFAISGGDSGSALLAKINGVWKIIGLCFAGSNSGYACRIDYVASQLGIEAWDGTITPTSFVNPASIESITTVGVTTQESIIVNGKTYRQSIATLNPPTV